MSDTSQGEGWWIASDNKWYPPETHPDYVAPEPTAATGPGTGPAASEPATTSGSGSTSIDPAAGFTDTSDGAGEPTTSGAKNRTIFIGVAVAALIAIIAFIGFRFFNTSKSGAASPEEAAQQFITSLHELDVTGVTNVLVPSETESFMNGLVKPVFSALDDLNLATDTIEGAEHENQQLAQLKGLLDVKIDGGADGSKISATADYLDDNKRMARVSIDEARIALSVNPDHPFAQDKALVFAHQSGVNAINLSQYRDKEAQITIKDVNGGTEYTITYDGETHTETNTNTSPQLITIEENGRWYVSPGYTVMEVAADIFELPEPVYGTGFEVAESGNGGADSPQGSIQTIITSIFELDPDSFVNVIDPVSFAYVHDYYASLSDTAREELRFLEDYIQDLEVGLEFGETSEWNSRQIVQVTKISGAFPTQPPTKFTLDLSSWCVEYEEYGESQTMCFIDEYTRNLKVTPQELKDALPDHLGFAAVERNSRWYLDPISTAGYQSEQFENLSDKLAELSPGAISDFDLAELQQTLITTGPFLTGAGRHSVEPVNGVAGIGVDLSDFPTATADTSFSTSHYNLAFVHISSEGDLSPGPTYQGNDPSLALLKSEISQEGTPFETLWPGVVLKADASVDFEIVEPEIHTFEGDSLEITFDDLGTPALITLPEQAHANYVASGQGLSAKGADWHYSTDIWLDRPDLNESELSLSSDAQYFLWGEPGSQLTISTSSGFTGPETAPVQILGTALPYFDTPNNDEAIGQSAPGIFAQSTRDNELVVLGEGQERVYIFVAHWCPYCQEELETLSRLYKSGDIQTDVEVVVVSSAVDSTRPNYPPTEWFSSLQWPTQVVSDDENSSILRTFGLSGFPTTVAVDANGIVRSRGLSFDAAIASLSGDADSSTKSGGSGSGADTGGSDGTGDGEDSWVPESEDITNFDRTTVDSQANEITPEVLNKALERGNLRFDGAGPGGYFDGCPNGPDSPDAITYHFYGRERLEHTYVITEHQGSALDKLEQLSNVEGQCSYSEWTLEVSSNTQREFKTSDPDRTLPGLIIKYKWTDHHAEYVEYHVAEGDYIFVASTGSEKESIDLMTTILTDPILDNE